MKPEVKNNQMSSLAIQTVGNMEALETAAAKPAQGIEAKGVFYLGLILIIFQMIDGIFTSIGITRWGTEIEGNPMLRLLMEQFGHIPTLTMLKIFAIAVIVTLTFVAKHLPWVRFALGAVSCIYFFTAIIPWGYILFINPPV